MVIINILIICLLLFNGVYIKADSDDNLYMNAYQATLVAINRKTQESINVAREAIALLPKHLDWAIGEFSRKLDAVQNPILVNIIELINIANNTEKQDDINRARLAIPTGLPKEWLNTYSSAIDGIQNRLIAKITWAFQVLKVSKQKGDAITTRGLVNEVKKVEGNPGVQAWIKAIENELDTFIDSVLTINIKATTIPKGTPLVDILEVKNLEDKDIKNKYKVDYEVSDKGVIDDKGVFNPPDDASVFIKVKVLDVATPVTLINVRKPAETELQGFSIEDEWDVNNNVVYSSLEIKRQNIKVGEVNKKLYVFCKSQYGQEMPWISKFDSIVNYNEDVLTVNKETLNLVPIKPGIAVLNLMKSGIKHSIQILVREELEPTNIILSHDILKVVRNQEGKNSPSNQLSIKVKDQYGEFIPLKDLNIKLQCEIWSDDCNSCNSIASKRIEKWDIDKKFEKIFSICASGTNSGQQKSRVEVKYKNHTLLKEFMISVEDSDFYKQDHEVYVDETISFGTQAVVKVYEVDKNRNRIADVTGLKAGDEWLIQAYLKNDVDGAIRNLTYASNVDGFTIENNTPKGSYKLVVKRNAMEIVYKNIKIK